MQIAHQHGPALSRPIEFRSEETVRAPAFCFRFIHRGIGLSKQGSWIASVDRELADADAAAYLELMTFNLKGSDEQRAQFPYNLLDDCGVRDSR
jgi:hypothetical protein